LESVLGATPREFESRILRHLTCKNTPDRLRQTVSASRFVSVLATIRLSLFGQQAHAAGACWPTIGSSDLALSVRKADCLYPRVAALKGLSVRELPPAAI